MDKRLYPLKFNPIIKDKIWGGNKLHEILGKLIGNLPNIGESWELSGVAGNVSVVINGFLKGKDLKNLLKTYKQSLVGKKIYEKFGNEFPLLIKFIDAKEPLSIQVHPTDEVAAKRHGSFGKTEMWYVMKADNDAHIISGFNAQITPEQYEKAVSENSLENYLAKHTVSQGDIFFIPAGRVHSIGKGVMLAEIQQTSDLTYRIYDFNRIDDKGNKRELHTEFAKEAIDFTIPTSYRTNYKPIMNQSVEAVKSAYFSTNVIELNKQIERDYYNFDSFVILICVEGAADIEYNTENREKIKMGETILIPAELRKIRVIPQKQAKMLEVTIL